MWKSKLLEFLTKGMGTEGHKRCACGRDDVATSSSCCRSQNGNPANMEHPSSIGEDIEVSMYVCIYSKTHYTLTTVVYIGTGT